MGLRGAAASALAAALLGGAGATPAGLKEKLLRIAQDGSAKFNCSYSIGYRDASGSVGAAAGLVDGASTEATPDDGFAFGSVTKILTGASIMRLISEGHLALESKVSPLVDPLLADMASKDPKQGFSSLADLWGADNVADLTVQQLLSMTSGVPDFDTATPCFPGQPFCTPTDPLRQDLYGSPLVDRSPVDLMKVDWVANKWRGPCKSRIPFFPAFCYSSTNFMLLGLILLANQRNSNATMAWTDLDQAAFLPDYLREKLKFVIQGPPSKYSPVHGFDRTSYNVPKGEHNNHDNFNVAGVFSGWTASDIVATAGAVSDLVWEIYGPPSSVAPKELIDKMLPTGKAIYGLATFNLDSNTGHKGDYGRAYGHLGATYGYQSIAAYFPGLEFSLTIATNIERDYQEQPSYAMCFAYNAAASLLLGKQINCTYAPGGFYSGGCKCTQIESASTDATLIV